MKEFDELKESYDWEQFENHIRFGGVLDIYRRKKTGKISIFNLVEKDWFWPADVDEMMDYAVSNLDFYEQNPSLKKQKKTMTMDQFKKTEHFVPLSTYRKSTKKMDGKSIMTFGKHKGEKMANIPADYLLWLFDNNKCFGDLLTYIRANEDNLRKEVENGKKGIR